MPVLGVLLGETQFAEHLLHFPCRADYFLFFFAPNNDDDVEKPAFV